VLYRLNIHRQEYKPISLSAPIMRLPEFYTVSFQENL